MPRQTASLPHLLRNPSRLLSSRLNVTQLPVLVIVMLRAVPLLFAVVEKRRRRPPLVRRKQPDSLAPLLQQALRVNDPRPDPRQAPIDNRELGEDAKSSARTAIKRGACTAPHLMPRC